MHSSWVIVLVVVVLFVLWRWWSGRGINKLNSGALEARIKEKPNSIELVDVREPSEYKGGHIAFAKNIPLGQIDRKLDTLPKDKDIVFVCQSGARSMMAARKAKKAGLQAIYNLSGGMSAWRGPVKR
ncbi:rhodanese-like domain-containing protein [Alicyclobacillus ferrooxydans]|uniref:rhodanese-like domain-containing protein n=1 Tax=Alicyclobacillus ferrooxydans TaxID=471514 RepID=UPI0006D5861B|nr:rhodanese-like domain-containing protein [Alicyclobacillus ferrooxydans]